MELDRLDRITGNLVTLALLERSFINEYLRQFSPRVRSVLHVGSLADEQKYLEDRLAQAAAHDSFFFCIFDNESHDLIGAIEIRDPAAHKGQLYCWLNEGYWGSGAFQESIKLALDHYFKRAGKHAVTAHVDTSNLRSYKALKKAGFADLSIIPGPAGKQFELIFFG